MFTGLIEDIGTVRRLSPLPRGARLEVATHLPLHEVKVGDSIAVMGACLTVTELRGEGVFGVDVSGESLDRTRLGGLRPGDRVHLERALRANGRLDGHIVQGHVDGLGEVVRNERDGLAWQLVVRAPVALWPELCEKGSVAVDGVSLTVNELLPPDAFRLTLVPHSATATLLAGYPVGRAVHLETDVLAKYVRRMLSVQGSMHAPAHPPGGIEAALRRNGWLDG